MNMNFVLFGKPTSGGVTKNESNISSSDLYANYNEFESDTEFVLLPSDFI